jgi:probable F420-dependent oxidoreductase
VAYHGAGTDQNAPMSPEELVEFGFSLPGRGPLASPDPILKIAQRAEALRYSSVFVTDHVVLPVSMARSAYPYSETRQLPGGGAQDYLEPLAVLAWLAQATTKVRIGTSVLVIPYRNPVLAAKMLATIDQLSKGRVILGAGVGWLREEFEALGAPSFDRRGAVSDEILGIFRTLWTRSPSSFRGEFFRFDDVKCLPAPVQKPHPPIWIGGHSRAALRRVARYGDGWHPVGATPAALLGPDDMRTLMAELHRFMEAEGRDPAALTVAYKAPIYDTEVADADKRRPFSGPPAQVLEDIGTYERLGVHELIFDFRSDDLAESLDRMERVATLTQLRRDAASVGR